MPPSNSSKNQSTTKRHNQTASNKNPSAASSSSHTMTSMEVAECESDSEFEPVQPKRSKVEEKNQSNNSPTTNAKIIYNMNNCNVRIN